MIDMKRGGYTDKSFRTREPKWSPVALDAAILTEDRRPNGWWHGLSRRGKSAKRKRK
jgi:hypothetical protein